MCLLWHVLTGRACPLCAVQTFVAKLDAAGQRWVPILDPPIHVQPGYAAYDSGIADDVFLKDITGRPFTGQVIHLIPCYAPHSCGVRQCARRR